MCYDAELQNNGLGFKISNCFGIGFDWEDEEFKEAVRNRDERIWGILEWAANGGADVFNQAAEFEEHHTSPRSYSSVLSYLRSYDRHYDLAAMRQNPHLTERAKRKIDAYYSGELEEWARQERQAEKDNRKSARNDAGSVYLILAENGLYKIGKARNISTRMQPFSVHFPMKWEMVYSFKSNNYSQAEAVLHEKYADKRDVGEWFRLSADDVQYIKGIKDNQL